jgi:hypothetical protein
MRSLVQVGTFAGGTRVRIATVDLCLGGSTMLRKPIAYLLVVAILVNVGCTNLPFPLPWVAVAT